MTMYENIAKSKAGAGATNITLTTSESDVYNALFHDNFISETTDDALPGTYYYPKSITSYFNALGKRLYWTEYASLLPRDALGKYTGAPIRVEGTVLESDAAPAGKNPGRPALRRGERGENRGGCGPAESRRL